jgi:hypothetical protein
MDNKHKVYNLIILDESGSMQSIKKTIINGFNEVVQTIKNVALQYPEQEHTITFISFNSSGIKKIQQNSKIELLNQIDDESYMPDGGTPLFDAMGSSFYNLECIIAKDKPKNYNVLVTILTDGEENASREHSAQSIKAKIDELTLKNWTFTYIGANHDVDEFASRISITNVMKFETNEEDMRRMFEHDRNSRVMYSAKIRRGESTRDFYFDDVNREKDESKTSTTPKKKSFWQKLFGN